MLLFIFFHIHTFPLVLGHKTNHSQSFNTAVYISLHNWLLSKTNYVTRRKTCIKPIVNDSSFVFRALINHRGYWAEKALIHFKKIIKGPWSYKNVYWVLHLTMTIYSVIIISSILWPWVVPVNVHNLFRARICGTGQLLQITPPTFLCELSNKIDQTLQWIESRSNGFNRARPNTNFNVQIFHDEIPIQHIGANRNQKLKSRWITDFNIQIFHNWNINRAHIYVQRATGIKKWTSGLITGNDERSSRVVAEPGR